MLKRYLNFINENESYYENDRSRWRYWRNKLGSFKSHTNCNFNFDTSAGFVDGHDNSYTLTDLLKLEENINDTMEEFNSIKVVLDDIKDEYEYEYHLLTRKPYGIYEMNCYNIHIDKDILISNDCIFVLYIGLGKKIGDSFSPGANHQKMNYNMIYCLNLILKTFELKKYQIEYKLYTGSVLGFQYDSYIELILTVK